jgi:hypothetical protein
LRTSSEIKSQKQFRPTHHSPGIPCSYSKKVVVLPKNSCVLMRQSKHQEQGIRRINARLQPKPRLFWIPKGRQNVRLRSRIEKRSVKSDAAAKRRNVSGCIASMRVIGRCPICRRCSILTRAPPPRGFGQTCCVCVFSELLQVFENSRLYNDEEGEVSTSKLSAVWFQRVYRMQQLIKSVGSTIVRARQQSGLQQDYFKITNSFQFQCSSINDPPKTLLDAGRSHARWRLM